ncbi:S8 family serine peptidase [Micromonospora sp. NPDC006766]|uniref:S8 family serine peptidase n=1 Tax=Micromonospora sp. NPDC006766 TaxID=3154778 RepID=UPI0033C7FAF6
MRLTTPRRLLAAVMVPLLAATPAAAKAQPVMVAGPEQSVIVILTDQGSATAATGPRQAERSARFAGEQAAVLADLRQAGATRTTPFHLLNAVAATLPASAVRSLAARPGIRAVLPDRPVRLRQPVAAAAAELAPRSSTSGSSPTESHAATSGRPGCAGPGQTPVVEPEGLTLTRTIGAGHGPGAHDLADGSGVRVGVLGGAISRAATEFMRDGRSIIAGYADFTGEGLDTPSYILESFGDASVIAAQGVGTYDIDRYAHPAHRSGTPCPARILGVAPGATVHVAKVFSGVAAPTSVIMQGIEWAVFHENVDVLNESLVTYGYPDTADNALRLANDAATAAGVTVVVAAGDAGPDDTLGSPASAPDVIAVGASTQFRAYHQLGYGGAPLGDGFRSDSVSALSSGGTAQAEPRTVDLVAPGDSGWAACSTDTARYQSCMSFFDGGSPSPFFLFGGTSAAAPFVAGAAALVIQTMRRHHGVTPTPRQVKQILMSTATDLRQPASQQGAGRVDTLAAVRLAADLADAPARGGRPNGGAGESLLVDPSTPAVTGTAGQTVPVDVTVTNPAATSRRISLGLRTGGPTRRLAAGRTTLTPQHSTPFTDVDGSPAYGRRMPLAVPRGTDQLTVAVAWDPRTHSSSVGVSVFDPAGRLAGYSLPLGNGGYGRATVARPEAGRWTVAIWTGNDGSPPVGAVRYDISAIQLEQHAGPAVVVPAGASRTVRLPVRLATEAGDSTAAITVSEGAIQHAALPLGRRTLVRLGGTGGRFTGAFHGGNGVLAGWALLGQRRSFQLDVPAGKPVLNVSVTAGEDPGLEVWGLLVAPDGMVLAATSSRSAGAAAQPRLDLVRRHPRPGRWTVVLVLNAPSTTGQTTRRFSGTVGFAPVRVSAAGLPAAGAVLAAGTSVGATLTVTNTGTAPRSYFIDARLDTLGEVTLRPTASAIYQTPVSGTDVYPRFFVPTGTSRLRMTATSQVPHALDTQPFGENGYYVGDPDIAGTAGRRAEVTVEAAEIAATTWVCNANQLGPFGVPPQEPAEVSCAATAVTRRFDDAVDSSTGNPWWRLVEGSAAPVTPLTLAPGQAGRITLTFVPAGPAGRRVTGTLALATIDPLPGFGTELAQLPYAYTVGAPATSRQLG